MLRMMCTCARPWTRARHGHALLAVMCLALAGCMAPSGNVSAMADSERRAFESFKQRELQRSSCSAGRTKVCDRRKNVGCRCVAPGHVRALIGA